MNTPTLKIVTIDESPMISKRIQSLLGEVQEIEFSGNAQNIPSALRLIKQQKPNVVILDIQLNAHSKKGNGIDLLSKLRKDFPEIRLIVLTNCAELHYRITCLAEGANYFFDKTNDFSKIAEALKAIHSKINEN